MLSNESCQHVDYPRVTCPPPSPPSTTPKKLFCGTRNADLNCHVFLICGTIAVAQIFGVVLSGLWALINHGPVKLDSPPRHY